MGSFGKPVHQHKDIAVAIRWRETIDKVQRYVTRDSKGQEVAAEESYSEHRQCRCR
jgi:hypothetical protein